MLRKLLDNLVFVFIRTYQLAPVIIGIAICLHFLNGEPLKELAVKVTCVIYLIYLALRLWFILVNVIYNKK